MKAECFSLIRYKNVRKLKQAVTAYLHCDNGEQMRLKLKGLNPVKDRTSPHLAA
ncbi:IS3 family transposase [Izhakiella capsodis]|uniref:IS3 family transposase n=1 Tax=Izhakiella capsodis TaxID=1367852 RepID=UPI0038B2702B